MSSLFRSLSLVTALLLSGVVSSTAIRAAGGPGTVSVGIAGPGFQQSGAPVPITITLTNSSGASVLVPQADFSGQHAELDYLIQATDYRGVALSLTTYGQYVNGSVIEGSVRGVQLASGQSVQEQSDISQIVTLSSPGFYLVSVAGPAGFAAGAIHSNTLPLIVTSIGATPVRGDLNGDGVVDLLDVAIVDAALNAPALGSQDPRDLDKDGKITVQDARFIVTLCTYSRCASHP